MVKIALNSNPVEKELDKLPRVIIAFKETVRPYVLKKLRCRIRKIIAARLHCKRNKAGALVPEDVEVKFEKVGELDIPGKFDLQIYVQANEVPERKRNLKQRTVRIKKDIEALLPQKLWCFVWVLLAPGAFEEFQGVGCKTKKGQPPRHKKVR